jgi:FkbH-like protein
MKLALVGDVALDVLAPYFKEAGYDVYVPSGFGAWRQELLDGSSPLGRFAPDFVFDVTAHDEALSSEVEGFFDERMRSLASQPYSLAGIKALVEEFGYFRLASPKKVLAVDADNTLWRGILSEDGRDALVPCTEFQKGLLALREKGVALVLLSKNDPCENFMREDFPLRDSDFAARRVNWAPKAGNLIEACRELNVSVDSVVFVDDNPHERAQMSAHLPEVTVLPWNGWDSGVASPEARARCLLRRIGEYFFSGMGRTAEDRLRAASYAAKHAAESVKSQFKDVGEYLRSLELKAEARIAEEADLDRLAQMASKTNQFNATTIRRSRDGFAALLEDASKRVFVFRARDRFGEQGIVCYIVADLESRRITDFVMSCRAMGRTLEHFAYNFASRSLGYSPAIDFTPSAKNAPFAEFLRGLKPVMETYYEER